MDQASSIAPSVIVHGSARLPKSIGGEQSGTLIVELTLDAEGGHIADVAATVSLPGYVALLRSLLVGCRRDEVEAALEQLASHLRGPLLRPTIAALANAVSNHQNSAGS